LNQYTVDAMVLQDPEANSIVLDGAETNENHNNFNGQFIVTDYYESR